MQILPGLFIGCRSEKVEIAAATRRAKENARGRTGQHVEDIFRVQHCSPGHTPQRSGSLMTYPRLHRIRIPWLWYIKFNGN